MPLTTKVTGVAAGEMVAEDFTASDQVEKILGKGHAAVASSKSGWELVIYKDDHGFVRCKASRKHPQDSSSIVFNAVPFDKVRSWAERWLIKIQ